MILKYIVLLTICLAATLLAAESPKEANPRPAEIITENETPINVTFSPANVSSIPVKPAATAKDATPAPAEIVSDDETQKSDTKKNDSSAKVEAPVIAVVPVAAPLTNAELKESLRASLDQFDKRLGIAKEVSTVDSVEISTDRRYEDLVEPVKTSSGSLTISGLLQVWYQSVQNDPRGNFYSVPSFHGGKAVGIFSEENAGNSSDTFRIRRSELRFTCALDKNILATVMVDPARESNSLFYSLPTLLRHNTANSIQNNFRTGTIPADQVHPSLLQEATIVFHDLDFLPHHSIFVGQFKPPSGDEALQDSGRLDFVERAMVSAINNVRDTGVAIYGAQFNSRLQYQAGVFNGVSGTVLTDPEVVEAGNRSDDNDNKDFAWRIQVRPLWDDKKLSGNLELGYHRTDGVHGEQGQEFDPSFGISGVNRQRTHIVKQGVWGSYRPSCELKGLWLRGEWGRSHDIYGGDAKTTALGLGSILNLGEQGGNVRGGQQIFNQRRPLPVDVTGWFVATGYKVGESPYAECLSKSCWLSPLAKMEFAFRYERYENIATEKLVESDYRTDLFSTQVVTLGANYNVSKNARLQTNYLIVKDPTSNSHFLRGVNNNVLVVNFQVNF